jgi:hypothetical protein
VSSENERAGVLEVRGEKPYSKKADEFVRQVVRDRTGLAER